MVGSRREPARATAVERGVRRPRRTVAPMLPAAVALAALAVGPLALPASPTMRVGHASPSAGAPGSSWTVYHGNSLGTGVASPTTLLRRLRPAWHSPILDGQLYGEPLVDAGRVLAATEDDTVYEIAADTGRVIWRTQIGTPVPASDLPCSDISPDVGITGTPVIDTTRHEIFVVADELTGDRGASHHLVGLDIGTGHVELDEEVNPPQSTPTALLQRPGLALDQGSVVVAFGGNYGDCGSYHGTVASVPEAGGAPHYYVVDSAKGERQGAVWMGGAAPLVDRSGNIWFAVGNGSQSSMPYDDSDSVTELSPTLRREQLFAPASWAVDNRTDADLGSSAPVLVDGYVFQVGKAHVAYLLDARHLGGIGHEVARMPLCTEDPHGGIAVHGSTLYVACGEGVTAVKVSRGAPHMTALWTTTATPSGAAIDGPPIVAGGLVWSLDAYGTLWGLDPANGRHVVEEQTGGGEANHFPTPAAADRLLLVPTTDQIFAFEGSAGLPGPPVAAADAGP